MGKQIYYIDYYVEEKRQGTIGFLKVGVEKTELILRNVPIQGSLERNVYLIDTVLEEKQLLTKIVLKGGSGQAEIDKGVLFGNIGNKILRIPITTHSYGLCVTNKTKKEVKENEVAKSGLSAKGKQKISELRLEAEIEPMIEADKWMQICKSYPNVHIFPQAQSVLIKPKDMIILNRDYHGLATNSFLLHAYYNYRQLLLCCDEEDERYYLGVPGVYYERERQLALLYGFEEFEIGESLLVDGNRREVYLGCFGYYKKRVEI